MDINTLKEKIESIFLELGFRNEIIGEKQYRYLVHNNCYCKITYLNSREAFVIECADNVEDASNGVLEDGDLYYLNIPEEEMLCKLRKDIVAYYME